MRLGIGVVCALVAAMPGHGQDLRQTPEAKSACGVQDAKFSTSYEEHAPATVPEPGKALVYLIQRDDPVGATCLGSKCGVLTKVGLDGAWLGATQGNSYLIATVPAGAHHVCANIESHAKSISELVALYGFEAEAGKTYYLGIHTNLGFAIGSTAGLSLAPLNEDEGRMLVQGYPYSRSKRK